MSKPVKNMIEDSYRKLFGEVDSAVIIDICGVKANDNNTLRSSLAEREIRVTVVKNSLAKRAFADTPMQPISDLLDGPCAMVTGGQSVVEVARGLIAPAKAIANLERFGDEAARIARAAERLVNTGVPARLRLPVGDLRVEAELATASMRKALDAFARLDAEQALSVLKHDDEIDQEFDGLLRKLITYMMEDPRTISASIDLVFVAKAIERIGDHAKNIGEAVIYIVKGTDVRHQPMEDVEGAVR